MNASGHSMSHVHGFSTNMDTVPSRLSMRKQERSSVASSTVQREPSYTIATSSSLSTSKSVSPEIVRGARAIAIEGGVQPVARALGRVCVHVRGHAGSSRSEVNLVPEASHHDNRDRGGEGHEHPRPEELASVGTLEIRPGWMREGCRMWS